MKIRLTCVHHEALMIDCIVHDVPFPAYETFDHRQNLPRRFFLFFDKLFRAGRHNKELWSAAITRNKGRNNISFGTCIFEAHVRTTIQENYFAPTLTVMLLLIRPRTFCWNWKSWTTTGEDRNCW